MLSPPEGHAIGGLDGLEFEAPRPLLGKARSLGAHGRPGRPARRPPWASLLGPHCASDTYDSCALVRDECDACLPGKLIRLRGLGLRRNNGCPGNAYMQCSGQFLRFSLELHYVRSLRTTSYISGVQESGNSGQGWQQTDRS